MAVLKPPCVSWPVLQAPWVASTVAASHCRRRGARTWPWPWILSSGLAGLTLNLPSGHVWDEVNREELLQVRLVLGDSALSLANLPEGSQVNWKIKVSLMVPIPLSSAWRSYKQAIGIWSSNHGFPTTPCLPKLLGILFNFSESEFSHMQREHDVHFYLRPQY